MPGPASRIDSICLAEKQNIDARIHRWLRQHSIVLLRLSLGIVFLGFGVLKYFPGVSPAEELSKQTMDALTLGLVPPEISIVIVASVECAIGLLLIVGRWLRPVVYLLAAELIGILAPLGLFPGRLFAGPHGAPTLEGQYVLKDIILVAAGLVVASTVPGLVPGADPDRSARQAEEEKKSEGARGGDRTTHREEWTDSSAVRAESNNG
jgi:putative oxidoreductase